MKYISISIKAFCTALCTINVASAADPEDFCKFWAEQTTKNKAFYVQYRADSYAKTSPSYSKKLSSCMTKETYKLIRNNNAYYLCDSGNNFTAGVILGQALNTSHILCVEK